MSWSLKVSRSKNQLIERLNKHYAGFAQVNEGFSIALQASKWKRAKRVQFDRTGNDARLLWPNWPYSWKPLLETPVECEAFDRAAWATLPKMSSCDHDG